MTSTEATLAGKTTGNTIRQRRHDAIKEQWYGAYRALINEDDTSKPIPDFSEEEYKKLIVRLNEKGKADGKKYISIAGKLIPTDLAIADFEIAAREGVDNGMKQREQKGFFSKILDFFKGIFEWITTGFGMNGGPTFMECLSRPAAGTINDSLQARLNRLTARDPLAKQFADENHLAEEAKKAVYAGASGAAGESTRKEPVVQADPLKKIEEALRAQFDNPQARDLLAKREITEPETMIKASAGQIYNALVELKGDKAFGAMNDDAAYGRAKEVLDGKLKLDIPDNKLRAVVVEGVLNHPDTKAPSALNRPAWPNRQDATNALMDEAMGGILAEELKKHEAKIKEITGKSSDELAAALGQSVPVALTAMGQNPAIIAEKDAKKAFEAAKKSLDSGILKEVKDKALREVIVGKILTNDIIAKRLGHDGQWKKEEYDKGELTMATDMVGKGLENELVKRDAKGRLTGKESQQAAALIYKSTRLGIDTFVEQSKEPLAAAILKLRADPAFKKPVGNPNKCFQMAKSAFEEALKTTIKDDALLRSALAERMVLAPKMQEALTQDNKVLWKASEHQESQLALMKSMMQPLINFQLRDAIPQGGFKDCFACETRYNNYDEKMNAVGSALTDELSRISLVEEYKDPKHPAYKDDPEKLYKEVRDRLSATLNRVPQLQERSDLANALAESSANNAMKEIFGRENWNAQTESHTEQQRKFLSQRLQEEFNGPGFKQWVGRRWWDEGARRTIADHIANKVLTTNEGGKTFSELSSDEQREHLSNGFPIDSGPKPRVIQMIVDNISPPKDPPLEIRIPKYYPPLKPVASADPHAAEMSALLKDGTFKNKNIEFTQPSKELIAGVTTLNPGSGTSLDVVFNNERG